VRGVKCAEREECEEYRTRVVQGLLSVSDVRCAERSQGVEFS